LGVLQFITEYHTDLHNISDSLKALYHLSVFNSGYADYFRNVMNLKDFI